MNKWDKVEKKKRMATSSDMAWENIKLLIWFAFTATYLYFTFRS